MLDGVFWVVASSLNGVTVYEKHTRIRDVVPDSVDLAMN